MKQVLEEMRACFMSGETLDVDGRIRRLQELRQAIGAFEEEILAALETDLGKAAFEGYATELGVVYGELDHTLRHLRAWAKPRRMPTPMVQFPSASRVYAEPLGVVLIMSPWNYPFQLAIAPLIAALAAGNCAVVKPSRYASATAAVVERLLQSCFPPRYVSVFQGGGEVNTRLLEQRFDHIFFTGSVKVGKVVMRAAAEQLTPVTLELGGKSPAIVDGTADIDLAARRIVWGKCINAGQTCVAPDYLLVQREAADKLTAAMIKYIGQFYGENPLENPEYPKIVNAGHFERLSGLLASGKILFGGRTDPAANKIEPTILTEVAPESPIMREEIFGPLLPVIPFADMAQAVEFVRQREKPLALYLFTSDGKTRRRVLQEISFGGGCINDTLVHLANPHMPFGGVGQSGMGAYHGRKGFETFSHYKSVLQKANWLDLPVRYAPYGERLGLLKRLMK